MAGLCLRALKPLFGACIPPLPHTQAHVIAPSVDCRGLRSGRSGVSPQCLAHLLIGATVGCSLWHQRPSLTCRGGVCGQRRCLVFGLTQSVVTSGCFSDGGMIRILQGVGATVRLFERSRVKVALLFVDCFVMLLIIFPGCCIINGKVTHEKPSNLL